MTIKPTGAVENPAPLTDAEKQRRRTADLDRIARAAGWQTWQRYSTAVKRGIISIAANPAPAPRRKRQVKEQGQ